MEPKAQASAIFQAAIRAVQPRQLLPAYIQATAEDLRIAGTRYARAAIDRLLVIGAGKATAAMAAVAEEIFGDAITDGLISVKYGHQLPLRKIRVVEAGHPVPDAQSVYATRTITGLLEGTTGKDLVLCLISGGGSSLLADYPPGSSLLEVQEVFRLLLASGAAIGEINTIRKHLSAIKGGGLARIAYPATLITLILSDVIGDPLDMIASGPTVPDPTSFADAWEILQRYRLTDRLPPGIARHLRQGRDGSLPETPGETDPVFEHVHNYIIGSNTIALEAARQEAEKAGYETILLGAGLQGEARDAAVEWVAAARAHRQPGRKICLLAGGETTVTLRGKGTGGRNQEFALAAALALQGEAGITILSGGTDGNDGPTDAAGAVVDADTLKTAKQLPLDAAEYLAENDSWHFFDQAGGHLKTGPTRTNVMDIMIALIEG